MNKIFGIPLAAIALAAFTPAAMAADIIVVTHGQGHDGFWAVVKNGVSAAADMTGANVTYRAPETFNMVEMAAMIDAAAIQEPDGIVVSIPDADALGPSIERAVAAGIPVISINSGDDVSEQLGALLHVGQNEYDSGVIAGKRLAALGGTKGICINNEVGNVALDQRCDGFAEGFGGNVTVMPSTSDPAVTEAQVRAALESDEDLDTILGTSALFAGEPSVAAVKALGREGEVLIGSFDLSANFLEAVNDGVAEFGIDQQQYLQGFLPVVFLSLYADYGLMPGGNVPSGPNLITADKTGMAVELAAKGIR